MTLAWGEILSQVPFHDIREMKIQRKAGECLDPEKLSIQGAKSNVQFSGPMSHCCYSSNKKKIINFNK